MGDPRYPYTGRHRGSGVSSHLDGSIFGLHRDPQEPHRLVVGVIKNANN